MSNIRRVAELAGVSVATVSRTLKNPEVVAPATRERVQAAVTAANYRPNGMAVQFRSRRTGNLVVLVPLIANSFFARVIAGIQQAAQAAGYRVLLCDTAGDEAREREYAELVYARQADGVIQLRAFDPFAGDPDAPPVVNACEVLAEHTWPKVRLDNRAAARSLTEHLLALGHRRIALIKGPEDSPLTLERLAGYQEALTRAGIPPTRICCTRAISPWPPAPPRPRRCWRYRSGPPRCSAAATRWRSAPCKAFAARACECPRTCRWRASTTSPSPPTAIPR